MWTYIATGVLAAVMAAGSAWQVQNWRYDAKEKNRVEHQAETDRIAHRAELADSDRVIKAQNASAARAIIDRAAAVASRAAFVSLSDAADAALRTAQESHEACLDRATAFRAVFDSCTRQYGDLAEKADRHVNDIKTLDAAFPPQPE